MNVKSSHTLSQLCLCFSILMAISFLVFLPILEWPDAIDHIERKLIGVAFYPPDGLLLHVGDTVGAQRTSSGGYFSDSWMFLFNLDLFLINFERLPYVLAIIICLYYAAETFHQKLLLFCPPYIFSLCAPSQEVFALATLVAAFFISDKWPFIGIILALLSTLIDRSMVPNAFFLVAYIAFPFFRQCTEKFLVSSLVLISLIMLTSLISFGQLFSGIHGSEPILYGMSIDDALYTAKYGSHNFLALAASTMGLYGWMSIRPFPFFIYYPTICALFIIGFYCSKPKDKSFFLSVLSVSIVTLWVLPSLSQARYYPLLTLAAWKLLYNGSCRLGIRPLYFYTYVLLATTSGLVLTILNEL